MALWEGAVFLLRNPLDHTRKICGSHCLMGESRKGLAVSLETHERDLAGSSHLTENNPSATITVFCIEPVVANHLLLGLYVLKCSFV